MLTAVRPATGEDFTLVLPSLSAAVTNLYLADFAAALDDDAHAVTVLDGAGWHDPRALAVPDNVTLVALPPDSPELNPVERIWLYPRERFLSLRVLDDTEAIIEACCQAWNQLLAEPPMGRIQASPARGSSSGGDAKPAARRRARVAGRQATGVPRSRSRGRRRR